MSLSLSLYIYIYITVFNPVNPELGIITSRTIKIFKNTISNLNNPGQELNSICNILTPAKLSK